jgi:hypothetical protein
MTTLNMQVPAGNVTLHVPDGYAANYAPGAITVIKQGNAIRAGHAVMHAGNTLSPAFAGNQSRQVLEAFANADPIVEDESRELPPVPESATVFTTHPNAPGKNS